MGESQPVGGHGGLGGGADGRRRPGRRAGGPVAGQRDPDGQERRARRVQHGARPRPTPQLREANAKVQARFDLAREAIRSFQDGVNEDDMLKGEELKGLRNKLLRSAAGFYEKLEELLQGQSDRASRAILAQSYFELGELTDKIGIKPEALAVHRKALAIRRELASAADADSSAKLDLARSLIATGYLAEATGDNAGALSAYEEARALAGPLADGPGATDAARDVLGTSHHRIGLVLSQTGHAGRGAGVVPPRPGDPAEAGRRQPRRHRVPQRPGDQPQQHRHAAVADRPAGRGAGVVPPRPGDPAEAGRRQPRRHRVPQPPGDSHNNIGWLQSQTGQPAEALESYRRALAIRQKLADDNPAVTEFRSRLANSHNNIGWLQSQTGQPAEALESYRLALAIQQKLADDNPAVTEFRSSLANSHQGIGHLQSQTGQPAEALESYRQALAIQQKLADDNPAVTEFRSRLAHSHNDIGILQSETGQPAEALESIPSRPGDPAEAGRRQPRRHRIPGRIWRIVLRNIGYLRLNSGKLTEAAGDFAREAAIREKLAGDNPSIPGYRSRLANCLNNMAALLLRLGRPSEARVRSERAVALLETLSREDPETPKYRWLLAEGYLRFGQAREATGDHAGAGNDWKRAAALLQAIPNLDGEYTFFHGCCHAKLAGLASHDDAGISADEASSHAETAMALLEKSVAPGLPRRRHLPQRVGPRSFARPPRLPAPDDGPGLPGRTVRRRPLRCLFNVSR